MTERKQMQINNLLQQVREQDRKYKLYILQEFLDQNNTVYYTVICGQPLHEWN